MAVSKLSQITALAQPPVGSSFKAVGVVGGTTDNLIPTRPGSTGNASYYVATTGNDANPGTLASPWLTLQHAMNSISAIDGGGFNVVVNVGAGSFAGFGIKPTVGIGVLQFVGAGSASTTITAGPNDGVFNFGECISNYAATQTALIGCDAVTFDSSASPDIAIAIALPGTNFNLGNAITFVAADIAFQGGEVNTLGYILGAFQCQLVSIAGNYTIKTTGGTMTNAIFLQEGATLFDGGTWTITGSADTLSDAFIAAENGASYVNQAASYTGSINGQRYRGVTNASFGGGDFSRLGPTFFPGTAPGTLDASASYDRVPGPTAVAVSGLPAAGNVGARYFVTDATQTLAAGIGNIVAGTGTNKVPVYDDGTNWRIG
jgi:hypothetical protein